MTQLEFSTLTPGKPVRIVVSGKPVCVTRVGEEVFAVADTCTHSEAALSEGDVTGFKIECWLHGAEFDLRTGEALTLPAVESLEVFSVEKSGDLLTINEKTGAN
ncbi:MAG: non-heme iron oxygenase ferredoxin subunit [Actinobacteria bacterium]|jgi:3-phenylpropionate/trans-cinnamate dioxygenase ferredoxin subunit|nr:non-heme iron oxygenase ferredoxin subunit [Actinomycetota bacterium]